MSKSEIVSAKIRRWACLGLALGLLTQQAGAGVRIEPPPNHCPDAAAMREQVLQIMNAVREHGTVCGKQPQPAVTPLAWNPRLAAAAQEFAHALAERDTVSHEAVAGESLPQRLQRVGYRYSMAGENLAAGQDGVAETVSAWLASTAHCTNVMKPQFLELGLGCVVRPGTQYGTYWVAHFGTEFLE